MNLSYTPVKHISMRRGIMQIVVFFHFKSLGLLAVSLDNGNAAVVWCQLSK